MNNQHDIKSDFICQMEINSDGLGRCKQQCEECKTKKLPNNNTPSFSEGEE